MKVKLRYTASYKANVRVDRNKKTELFMQKK